MDQSPIRERVVAGVRERYCKRCCGWFRLTKFVKHSGGTGGYLGLCVMCRGGERKASGYDRDYSREYYKQHRKELRAKRRARYVTQGGRAKKLRGRLGLP